MLDGGCRRYQTIFIFLCLFGCSFLFYASWYSEVENLSPADVSPLENFPAEFTAEDESFLDNLLVETVLDLPKFHEKPSEAQNAMEVGNVSFDKIQSDPTVQRFDLNRSDVIVFLHIQKTGGTTFERYMVRQIDLISPCVCQARRKRCRCMRPNSYKSPWLFSRFSTGWNCGLHSDWTELVASGCVDEYFDNREHRHVARRYFITTFLREPVSRFISEFHHVRRGATWLASRHLCNGRSPTAEELPPCFERSQHGWKDVTLDAFLACSSNLAFNRQTRMLADLRLVHCYNRSAMDMDRRDAIMLLSAKRNLLKMAFFGLQDEMRRSQYLFERTFGLHFTKPMVDLKSRTDSIQLTDEQRRQVEAVNRLDLDLYRFAKRVFNERFNHAKQQDILLLLFIIWIINNMMTTSTETPLTVVFPDSLEMSASNRESLSQMLTVCNPYDVPLHYKVLCTAPNMYVVDGASGRLKPRICSQVHIHRIGPMTDKNGAPLDPSTDKFRVEVKKMDGVSEVMKTDIIVYINQNGKRQVGFDQQQQAVKKLTACEQRNRCSATVDSQTTGGNRRSSIRDDDDSALCNFLLTTVSIICLVILLTPVSVDCQAEGPSWYPDWLRVSLPQKLISAYVLGILTKYLIKP
ncbi:Heparan-sulfate 6-O-sulfotransferase 3 [Trichinella patagoniensis]|uniref:Heparan-sulfate 6-O-sulfotransferase n=1 Tax=Trichinella patagoniensis TaxID=990121 RepID=A0A0V0ZFX6_9BILA|nr:Heparan-sulfate 6-O-sulfotransferase 3 [Trichinella patagoniensis]